MPANTKEVKRRLNSIKSTRKITKAMELVAAAKMRKAVEAAQRTRTYHHLAWGIADRLLSSRLLFASENPTKRFFEEPDEVKHTTVIVFTGNRGLAGAFTANVVREVAPLVREQQARQGGERDVEIIAIGTRGATTLASLGGRVALAYKKDSTAATDASIREVADHAYHAFRSTRTDQVLVAYTDYRSALSQRAVVRELYPFKRQSRVGLGEDETGRTAEKILEAPGKLEYLYEPNKYDILDYLALRIGQAELYQALLESNASEHSCRMVAMKNASDAAGDMADELVLEYNKARQAAITREIAEISAGTAAVS